MTKKEVKEKDAPKEQKEVKEKKPTAKKAAAAPKPAEKENFRGIVRIAGKDVTGETKLQRALKRVRGISHTLTISAALAIKKELSIDPSTRVGELSDEQIENIDKVLGSLHTYGVPAFLLNRRGDFESGKNIHAIMNDLIFHNTQDIERDKKAYTWRGYRHAYGQKVRGQKTRNTGRTGMAVGVLRKTIAAAAGAAAKPATAGAAPAAAAKPAAGATPAAAAKPAAKPAEKK